MLLRRASPAVLLVAYGNPAHLAEALAGLGSGLDVVVVDNGVDSDADGGGEVAELARSAGATYVDPGRNLGFAAGVNLGLTHVPGGQDVLLLNPDAVLDGADLTPLQAALHAEPRIAAVSPALTYGDGRPQRVAWPLPGVGQVWRDALALPPPTRTFLIGAVLLLNGAALAEVGGLDERFFLYAEEADWQERARRAGWGVRVVDAVTATHLGSASSADGRERDAHFRASADAYARKWLGPVGYRLYVTGAGVARLRRRAQALTRPRGAAAP